MQLSQCHGKRLRSSVKDSMLVSMAEELTRRLLSVTEACHYLHLSRGTLYHMIRQKDIMPVRLGHRTLFDVVDLDELIQRAKGHDVKPSIKVRRRIKKH